MAEITNGKKYIYRCFGLVIGSYIAIPEFLEGEGIEDITVLLGRVPDDIDAVVEETEKYKISKTEFLFFIEGVGKYYIKQGKIIIVEPEKAADKAEINAYLVGTAIGTALLQRGMLPIHGSSVIFNGRAAIFTGDSGAGKSTMCAALRKKGYEFLGDDISVVTINEDGVPMVQSSFPHQRLRSDTLEAMGYDKSDFSLACKTDDKYVIADYDKFNEGSVRLAAIFEISTKQDGEVELKKDIGTKKLWKIIENIYYVTILSRLGIDKIYFKQCLAVAKNIQFYEIIRPIDKLTVEDQIRKVKLALELQNGENR